MATHAHTEVSLRRRRSYGSYVMPAFAALLVGLLLFWLVVNFVKGPSYFVTIAFIGLTNGALYALVALGYTLVYGILELINFAHGDVFMLGGLFSATMLLSVFNLHAHASTLSLVAAILGSLLVAMAACGLLNAGIERVAYRPLRGAPRLAPLITAIGMSFILEDVAIGWKGPNYTAVPNLLPTGHVFSVSGITYTWEKLIVIAITVPVLLVLVWLVKQTRQGKAMRATAQDRDAATLMGIDTDRVYRLTFAIGIACVGAAGVLVSPLYAAYPQAGLQFVTLAYVVVVLGGLGDMAGAMLGSLIVAAVVVGGSYIFAAAWKEVFYFLLFIGVLVFRPAGLLGQRGAETLGV